jgi:hypothetical protein
MLRAEADQVGGEVANEWRHLCRLERVAVVCFQSLSGISNRQALRLEIINWVATGKWELTRTNQLEFEAKVVVAVVTEGWRGEAAAVTDASCGKYG